jgi:hypothetical protein
MGEFPVVDGGQSNLKFNCATTPGTPGDNTDIQKIQDFNDVQWHSGASRTIVVTGSGTAVTFIPGTANGHLQANDAGKVITGPLTFAAGKPPFDTWLPPKDFIVSESGNTITLAIAPLKPLNKTKLVLDNGPGRVLSDVTLTNNSTNVTSTNNDFYPSDVGLTLSGTNVDSGTTIAAYITSKHVTLSANAHTDAADGDPLPCGAPGCSVSLQNNAAYQATTTPADLFVTTSRMVQDLHTTKTSATITSATAAFHPSDVGLPIIEASAVGANAWIASVSPDGLSATMDNNINGTIAPAPSPKTQTTGRTFIGNPSASSPADGEYVSQLATQLVENPGLVTGAAPCASGLPTGTLLNGVWESPNTKTFLLGAHAGGGLDVSGLNMNQVTAPIIAQVLYETSVVTFAAYVDQHPDHYEIVFPEEPVGIGVCSNTATAAAYSFIGATPTQLQHASGFGQPGTLAVRGIVPFAAGVTTGTGHGSIQGYDSSTGNTLDYDTGDLTCAITQPASLTFAGAYPCGKG